MPEDSPFCSALSVAEQEPLSGTAPPDVRYWLLVEDHGPWGKKEPNAMQLLAPELRRAWDALGKQPGLKRLYLRRPRNPATMPDAPRRVWVAENRPQGGELVALQPHTIAQLVEAMQGGSLQALMRAGTPVESMWLVCTHGQRDRCCSLYGTGLFLQLDQQLGQGVWQCSHLGGHRFAATALHLPSGYLWGRLRAEDAPDLATLGRHGELPCPSKLRGHSGLSAKAQAADLWARRHRKRWEVACEQSFWTVDATERRFHVEGLAPIVVEEGPELAVAGSCGDDTLKRRHPWVARFA